MAASSGEFFGGNTGDIFFIELAGINGNVATLAINVMTCDENEGVSIVAGCRSLDVEIKEVVEKVFKAGEWVLTVAGKNILKKVA